MRKTAEDRQQVGNVNNLFQDISRIDRTVGDVALGVVIFNTAPENTNLPTLQNLIVILSFIGFTVRLAGSLPFI